MLVTAITGVPVGYFPANDRVAEQAQIFVQGVLEFADVSTSKARRACLAIKRDSGAQKGRHGDSVEN